MFFFFLIPLHWAVFVFIYFVFHSDFIYANFLFGFIEYSSDVIFLKTFRNSRCGRCNKFMIFIRFWAINDSNTRKYFPYFMTTYCFIHFPFCCNLIVMLVWRYLIVFVINELAFNLQILKYFVNSIFVLRKLKIKWKT